MKLRMLGLLATVLGLLVGVYATPVMAQSQQVQDRLLAETPAQDEGPTARISVVHASPDAPAVDVFLNGALTLENVAFFTASDYLRVPAGEYRVQVAPTGAGADAAVIDATLVLEADKVYTVAAGGFLADITAFVSEDNLAPTPAGIARVSVDHLSPDAPPVDVKLADGTFLAGPIAFGESAELEVPAGTYDLIVTPAGATEPVVISLPGTVLEEGNFYSVFAINPLAEIVADLFVTNVGVAEVAPPPVDPAPVPPAQVSVVHASPDTPAVDVFVDGALTLENVAFFTASDYLNLPAGQYRVQVSPTGAGVEGAAIDATVTVNSGQAYTIAAIGSLDAGTLTAAVFEDNLSAPADGEARVGVVHASPDAPAVDVRLADGTALISNLAFGEAVELDVAAGTYDLIVTPAGDPSTVVLDLAGTTLEAGNYYDVYAVGFLADIRAELVVTPLAAAPAPEPTPAPTTPPAPAPSPTPAPPVQLPETGGGNTDAGIPAGVLMTVALALIIGGTALTFGLRRRAQ